MLDLHKNVDTQFNIAFGLEKRSTSETDYVDYHGYLEWDIEMLETETIFNQTIGRYELDFRHNKLKHHRCTNEDLEQNFYKKSPPNA